MEFASAEFSACLLGSPLDMALMLSEASISQHLAFDRLFEDTSDPKFVAYSSILGCIQDEPSCSAKLGFVSTGPKVVSENIPSHHRIRLCLSLPANLLSVFN